MKVNYIEQYAFEQLRLQRHDFMNYLQVIYGYIQINKPNDAINYIKKINKYMAILSKIFNLECDAFGILFQEFINKCNKLNIEIELDLEIEYISCEHFSKDIEKKMKLFDTLTDKIIDKYDSQESDCRKLYINISGSPEDFNIIISSTKEINNKIYYSSIISIFQDKRKNDQDEPYIFYQRGEIIALLLNFN